MGPHCELRESALVPLVYRNDPYTNLQAGYDSGKSGFTIAVLVLSVLAIGTVLVFSATSFVRRRRQHNRALTSSLNWSPDYRDRAPEINIAPKRGSVHSPENDDSVYVRATEEAHASSSSSFPSGRLDPLAAQQMHPLAAKRATVAMQLMDTVHFSDVEPPDDLAHDAEPKIDIGPPRDEDGHELHNVEIV